jgi:hypothetical protein
MTKILLVERRYDVINKGLSITAEWINVPDGEEHLFLKKHLDDAKENATLINEESKPKMDLESKTVIDFKPKHKFSTEDIITIVGLITIAIGFAGAVFLNYIVVTR